MIERDERRLGIQRIRLLGPVCLVLDHLPRAPRLGKSHETGTGRKCALPGCRACVRGACEIARPVGGQAGGNFFFSRSLMSFPPVFLPLNEHPLLFSTTNCELQVHGHALRCSGPAAVFWPGGR